MVWLTGLRFQSSLFGGAGEGRRREKRGERKEKWGAGGWRGDKNWRKKWEGGKICAHEALAAPRRD